MRDLNKKIAECCYGDFFHCVCPN